MKQKKEYKDLENERYGLFMSENSFDLDIMYGRNFLKSDNVQYITLHKINVIETKSHNLYGQSKPQDKKYMPPIKLNVVVNVEESKLEYYGQNQGGISRDDTGNLVFGIYFKELEEHNIDIDRGDIVEYNLSGTKNRYYEVENSNAIPDTSSKTIGGFKNFWKKIICVPVKSDVTNLFIGNEKGEFK